MGGGKSKLKSKKRDNSRAYRSSAGGDKNAVDRRKTGDYTLAKTKGYDNLTANKEENRGRKKKK